MAGRLVTSTCISIKSRSSKGSTAFAKSAKKSKPSQFGKSRAEAVNAAIAKGIDFDAAKDNTTPAEIRSKAKILSPLKMVKFSSMAANKAVDSTDFSTSE